jgi:hypothetical protein
VSETDYLAPGRQNSHRRYFPHPALDVPYLTGRFQAWLTANEHGRIDDGLKALHDLEQGGVFGLHLQRKIRQKEGHNAHKIAGRTACFIHQDLRKSDSPETDKARR